MSQLNASAMNPEIRAAIEGFAKSRNVSPAACLQAAAIALAMQPFEEGDTSDIISTPAAKPTAQRAVKPTASAKRPPREAGEKSLQFRQDVINKAAELKGKRHTMAEVGVMFGLDQANTANNLKWLQKQNKINYQVVGYATKEPGKKGRAPAIIEFM